MRGPLPRIFLSIVTLALLAGCALQSALDRGHALVAEQRYRAALTEYQRALALDDDSEEAKRLVAQLVPYAVEEAEDEAAEAVAAGAYEKAAELGRYVRALDVKRGDALLADVERWMRASLEGLVAALEMDAAYPLAARARRLFPEMKGLERVFGLLRAHFHDRSERALAAGDHPGALAALDVIERHEPAQRPALEPKRQAIRSAWADEVVARGEAAEADGHLGVAAVHYARAHEIAARQNDRDRMNEALRVLEREGRFSLALRYEGDGGRRQILERIEAGARATDGVRLASDEVEAATMLATVHAEPLHCVQTFTPHDGQQEYVAGSRLVDNPRHSEIAAAVARASADADRLGAQLAQLTAEAAAQKREARGCFRREEQPALRRLDQAQRELTALERDLVRGRARVEALRGELDRTRDADARGRKERELAEAERQLAELEARRLEAEAAVAAQQALLDQARARCRNATDAAARAEAAALETRAALRSAERDLERLERELAATPGQVSEPILDVFHYEIRRFTRICEGPVAIDIEPAWTRGDRRVVAARRATEDDTHLAYPRYGVHADPLRFPLGDHDLRSGADEDAASTIVELLSGLVRDYYASMTDRATEMAATDADTATDMMVALLVAAPEQLSGGRRDSIATHLRQHYGLERLESLGR